MHTLPDLRGNIPTFVHITDGKVHDVNVLDQIVPVAGAFYVMFGVRDCEAPVSTPRLMRSRRPSRSTSSRPAGRLPASSLTRQSGLVRVHKVSVHRTLGWFGAGLATVMVALGFTIAVVMARFQHGGASPERCGCFLAIPFWDMIFFGTCMAPAILWRKKPDSHRRLIFLATCELMDAAGGRFDFWFTHSIFYVGQVCRARPSDCARHDARSDRG